MNSGIKYSTTKPNNKTDTVQSCYSFSRDPKKVIVHQKLIAVHFKNIDPRTEAFFLAFVWLYWEDRFRNDKTDLFFFCLNKLYNPAFLCEVTNTL